MKTSSFADGQILLDLAQKMTIYPLSVSDLGGKQMGKTRQLKGNPEYERSVEKIGNLSIYFPVHLEATYIPRDIKEAPNFLWMSD